MSDARSVALQQLSGMSKQEKRNLVKRQRQERLGRDADAIAARLAAWRVVLLYAARNQVTQDIAGAAVETVAPPEPPAQSEPLDALDALFA